MRFIVHGEKNMTMRFISLILCICILCVMFTLPSAVSAVSIGEELADIKDHWAESVIRKWVSQGLAKGYGDGRFGPNDSITRAEFVTLLNRIFGYSEMSDKSFPDVRPSAWYAPEISKAYKAGNISGDSSGNMKPEAVISRQEAAVILTRAFSLAEENHDAGSNPELSAGHIEAVMKYADVKQIAEWALGSVGAMTNKGYVTGRPGSLFAPADNLSRAEAVKMIDNVVGELINAEGTYTKAATGNIVVSSPGVTLKDTYIAGDLYLTEGIGTGTIQLVNVTVKGRTVIAKGIENISLTDTVLEKEVLGFNEEGKAEKIAESVTETGTVLLRGNMVISENVKATPKPTAKPSSSSGSSGKTKQNEKKEQKPDDTSEPAKGSDGTPTPTQGPTAAPTPTKAPTPTPTEAPTPTPAEATPTPTPKATATPSPTPKATVTPTPAPDITPPPTPDHEKVYYVRQRANGKKDGSDWDNAWTELPDVLERGATYYIAAGEYPSYRFDDPENGDKYIVIKKATVDDHGTDAGWKNGYGTGVALFTGKQGPIFDFHTGYYIIDGQTGEKDRGHGIKLYNPANKEAYQGGTCMRIPSDAKVRHLTIKHVEMQDAGWAGTEKDVPYKTRTVYAVGTAANIAFQYCYIHESGQEWMLFASPEKNFLIEHCYFKNGGSGSSEYHSVGLWFRGVRENMNIHIRYNTFENFARTGGTGYISLGYRKDPDTPTYSSSYYICGNVFIETSPIAGSSRCIGSNGSNGGPFLSDVKILNNTFYNLQNNSSYINLANKGDDNLAANNIWYGCDKKPSINIESKNNILNDLSYDPFIDAASGNFWLARELSGGIALGEPFNKDKDGAVRGADGVWDIGAFEYSKSRDERPRIENNTLVAPDGSRLRGGTFWLYGWDRSKAKWAISDAPWKAISDNKLNAIRVACAYRPEREKNYTLDEYEELLDKIIDRAESVGVTVVIDYHPEPGKYYSSNPETFEKNKKNARDFWTRIASRYKDRKNVVFELVNEPVFSGPNDYTGKLLQDFAELWQLCHKLAPDVPIIVLSFCQVGNHASDPTDWPSERARRLQGIDWRKTAVGFHSYWRDTSERIVDLKSKYPCINTEFMTYVGKNNMKAMDGYDHHGTLMEKLGISWLQWDILDREETLERLKIVIEDLKKHGVYWGTMDK